MNLASFLKRSRKRFFFLFSSIVFLAGLVWWQYPEYGDSYSEQQRGLWNKYLGTHEPFIIDSGWYEHSKEKADVYEKSDSILTQIVKLNRTENVPAFSTHLPDKLEKHINQRKTTSELQEQALTGDGNAALELFRRNLNLYDYFYTTNGIKQGKTTISTSFRKIMEQKKWINQAIENKRPGAEFLLDLLHKQTIPENVCSNNNTHFHDFLACIQNGDFLLFEYGTLAYPELTTGAVFQEMKEALRQKAKNGDKEAWRQIMELMLMLDLTSIQSKISGEFNQRYVWAEQIGLPERIPFQKKHQSQTLSDFLEAVSWCKKAADSGDMEAQYLWLKYSLPSLRRLNRNTLDDILQFHRNLIEKGYYPYFREFYYMLEEDVANKQSSSKKQGSVRVVFQDPTYSICHKIALSFLPPTDVKQLLTHFENHLFSRTKKSSQPSAYDLKQNWENDPDNFLYKLPQWLIHPDPQIRQMATKYINQLVEKDDLTAILTYASLYQKGQSVPMDKARALALTQKAMEIVNNLSPHDLLNSYFFDIQEHDHSHIDYITRLRFIQLNMDNTIPGTNPKKAFLLATQMFEAEQTLPQFEDTPGFILARGGTAKYRLRYHIGYMNEYGIGTPKDMQEAITFYEMESESYSPEDPYGSFNLSRLYEEGKGVEQSVSKALEYANKANKNDWRLTNELRTELKARIERLEEKRAQKKDK